MTKHLSITIGRVFLILVAVLLFLAGLVEAEPQANLTGQWEITTEQFTSSCSGGCPPLPFPKATRFINVVQQGNQLSGKLTSQNPPLVQTLTGTWSGNFGDPVNFTITVKGSFPLCATETHKAVAIVNSVTTFTGTDNYKTETSACPGAACTCVGNPNMTVRITPGSGGGGGDNITDISQSSGISENTIATTGTLMIDVNQDKKQDVLLIGKNGNALLKNVSKKSGAPRFVDVTNSLNIANGGREANGACIADIDNDKDLDILIANASGPLTLLKNAGGTFYDSSSAISVPVSISAVGETRGAIFFDYDGDEKIDAYVIKDGAPNLLLQNQGNTLIDVAANAGVDLNKSGRAAVSADFNEDGLQDLFVVNFKSSNELFLNHPSGKFRKVTSEAGLGSSGGWVQAVVNDFDGDDAGHLDLFVVNQTGSSVLYRNSGPDASGIPQFKKVKSSTLRGPKKGVAAAFLDVENDGDQDLVLVQSRGAAGGNILFKNNRIDANHVTFAKESIDLSRPDNPTGLTIGDFENDGDPDLAIGDGDTDQDRGDSGFQNSASGGFLSIIVKGDGLLGNVSAINAKVLVLLHAGFSQSQIVSGGNGQSQNSLPLLFGLGDARQAAQIIVTFPNGETRTFTNVPANKKLIVQQ